MKIAMLVALVGMFAAACEGAKPAAALPSAEAKPVAHMQEPAAAPTTPSNSPDEAAAPIHAIHEASAKEPSADNATFTRVEPSKVCMVNNHYMSKEQIPVVVEGKTYFGCCAMCEAKLAKDPTTRTAKDPVSGTMVDKAIAVIGSDPSGAVQYFENEKNFETYASR